MKDRNSIPQLVSTAESKTMQYEMLKELHAFCVQHSIQYNLAFGTLLGAIRHNGFIPWDDDIDVMMPIDDFMILLSEYNSPSYEIVCCRNNDEHDFVFARMYDKRTYEKVGSTKTLGLCVDIYLTYYLPDNNNHEVDALFRDVKKIRDYRLFLMRVKHYLAKRRLWFKKRYSIRLLNYLCRKAWDKECSLSVKQSPFSYIQTRYELFPSQWICHSELHQFEEGMFYIPSGYHQILTKWYGDYLKLPPEDQRHPHHGGNYFKK